MIERERLQQCAAAYGVDVDNRAAEKLDRYAELLVEWNQKMNLTAITDPEGILRKHFVDSLTALPYLPCRSLPPHRCGTGAGFPGVPLALIRKDVELTLLDSLNKRLIFLKELCGALQLPVTLVHARAEEGGRQPALREQFDAATARAVAALPVLAEYCLPFVKPGGRFIAMKGPEGDGEAETAARAAELLGGDRIQRYAVTLPKAPEGGGEERRLLIIDKTTSTPPAYPRHSAKIARQPL